MYRHKLGGFTLLEVLMVLLIMGLMVSVATSALPGGGTLEGTADEQADKLILIMEEISDRAAMEGRIIGLHVSEHGYSFMIQARTSSGQPGNLSLKDELMRTYWDQLSWVQYDAEDVAVKRDFDEGVSVSLDVGGLAVETADSMAETKLETVDFRADARDVQKRDLPQILSGEGEDSMAYLCEPKTDYQRWARNGSSVVHNHIAMKHTARLVEI